MKLIERWQQREEARRLYWWRPDDGRINVGDDLSPLIVASMLALHDTTLLRKQSAAHRLFAIGSVLHNARDGDAVWGSGINGKIDPALHTFTSLDVRAVRGPLTQAFLAGRGIASPDVYGDPALLMPLFFPREVLCVETSRPFVVVPHFNEPSAKFDAHRERLVLPSSRPLAFVRALLEAELVVSSSLHGVILAEAYGIPAVYLDAGNGESRFKYDDYYLGTGRPRWHAGGSVEECLALGGNGGFDVDGLCAKLMDAFPYDLWPRA